MKVRKGLNRKMVAGRKKKERRWGREKGERRNRREREGRRAGCKEGEGGKPSPVPFFLSFSFLYRHMFFLSFFLTFYFVLEYSRLRTLW